MTAVTDPKALAARVTLNGKGGFCNCPGLLLSLKAGRLDAPLFWEEPEPGGFLLLEKKPCHWVLHAVGRFTKLVSVPPREKPILFTAASGEDLALSGFRFFRRAVRMERSLEALPPERTAFPAREGDLPELLALQKENLSSVDLPGEKALALSVREGNCFVLRQGGALAATATVVPQGKRWFVQNIAVHKTARQSGFGRAVATASLYRAKACGALRASLWVDAANAPAIGLYESLGFQWAGQTSTQFLLDEKTKQTKKGT